VLCGEQGTGKISGNYDKGNQMKNDQIIECIRRAASAYRTLETAKTGCEDAVDAEIDLLVSECSEPITDADKKNIRKIARATASTGRKLAALTNETMSMAEILVAMMEMVKAGDDEGEE